MCDKHFVEDLSKYMTRRDFGTLSAGVGLMALLPPVANAQEVTEMDVEIATPDGTADCYFVHPSTGRHPAVLQRRAQGLPRAGALALDQPGAQDAVGDQQRDGPPGADDLADLDDHVDLHQRHDHEGHEEQPPGETLSHDLLNESGGVAVPALRAADRLARRVPTG